MASRDGALARAVTYFDSDGFRNHLAELVAIPSTSANPGHEADVQRYLADAIQPWLERMGFAIESTPTQRRASARSCLLSGWRDQTDRRSLTHGHGEVGGSLKRGAFFFRKFTGRAERSGKASTAAPETRHGPYNRRLSAPIYERQRTPGAVARSAV
jgi:hypothetical protein